MDTIDKILDLMNRNKVNAVTLTRDAGVTRGLVTQWKQRKQNPSMESITKIANYFNVSSDYLLGTQKTPVTEAGSGLDKRLAEIKEIWDVLPAAQQDELLHYARFRKQENEHNQ